MKFYHIHTSGHASIETLKKVTKKLKPKAIIPIHTFYPDKYKILSNNVHQIADAETIKVQKNMLYLDYNTNKERR